MNNGRHNDGVKGADRDRDGLGLIGMPDARPTTRVRMFGLILGLHGLGLMLAILAGLTAWLISRQISWAAAVLAIGIVGDEVLLTILLRRLVPDLAILSERIAAVTDLLETQGRLIAEQEGHLTILQAALADSAVFKQAWGMLHRQAKPNLEALATRLEEAEAALPDMAPQTKAWVSEVRRLASHVQASVESLANDMVWR